MDKHNQVEKIVHIQVTIKHKLIINPPPYCILPQPFLENEESLPYLLIITDNIVDHKRPNTMLHHAMIINILIYVT